MDVSLLFGFKIEVSMTYFSINSYLNNILEYLFILIFEYLKKYFFSISTDSEKIQLYFHTVTYEENSVDCMISLVRATLSIYEKKGILKLNWLKLALTIDGSVL